MFAGENAEKSPKGVVRPFTTVDEKSRKCHNNAIQILNQEH